MTAASGIGYLAASYTVSRWLTRRSRQRPQATPSQLGLAWEPAECVTADGLRLRGWVVEPSAAAAAPRLAATVALFHGMRGNRAHTLRRIGLLAAAGYRCVAFDHRAHGDSDGRRTSFGYHEGRDAAAVLEFVRRRWPEAPRAALGMSMGAAALCFAAEQTRGLGAVVLESLYHDLGSTFRSRIGTKYPRWLRRFTRGVIWVTERRLRVRLAEVAPADWVGRLAPAPVLLLTGRDDAHAPAHDAERLYARCRGPRELALIPGAEHANLFEAGGPLYRDTVLGFLGRHLRVAPALAA
jgi:alpha-beta hydrolase superfamily lysophospholipase